MKRYFDVTVYYNDGGLAETVSFRRRWQATLFQTLVNASVFHHAERQN